MVIQNDPTNAAPITRTDTDKTETSPVNQDVLKDPGVMMVLSALLGPSAYVVMTVFSTLVDNPEILDDVLKDPNIQSDKGLVTNLTNFQDALKWYAHPTT